ncbi:MAG: NADH-ubiquinone oxidoreductase-F iron-sulfur binding region domain-containing protein [Solirubrobacteraceae bacterium]
MSAPALTEATRLPRLLAGVPESGALSLAEHLEVHGALPIQARRRRSRDSELIDEIERSGLRGRGGAGFPTALKMHAVRGGRGRRRTVVVNAAEGEPASFKDRTLMRTVPHLVLDGAALAAQAVSAGQIVVCVSEASPETARCAEQAISERGRDPGEASMRLVSVPHSYVSGQESALVHHLNGGAATPTFTPPMIFESGVGARPTMLSNAETFAHVALIARHGADWFKSLGTPEHPGSALVTLSGPVAYPGVYEIEHGASLRSLVEAAGGLEDQVRAILVGGYAGTWIDGGLFEQLTLDDGWLVPHQASTGAGVVVLLGTRSCGVAETVRVARWLARESSGQCGPCLHGLDAIAARLQAWALGSSGQQSAEEISRLSSVVRGRGACRHPDGTLRFIASALQVFAEEFSDHARHGPCNACAAQPLLPLPGPPERTRAEAAGLMR